MCAVLVTGCDEALFTADDDKLPDIPDESTPWVEFDGSDVIAAAQGETVELTVTPGEAIGEPITVTYEVTGDAVVGTDYVIVSGQSPVTVPFNLDSNELDEAIIEVQLLNSGATAMRTVVVTLTGATADSGQSVDVGRGGTEIDQSRTIEIAPSN